MKRLYDPVGLSGGDPANHPLKDRITIGVGAGKVSLEMHLPPIGVAASFELTRPGATVVPNKARLRSPAYPKLLFHDHPEHLVNMRRVLFRAGQREETKALWQANDFSPDATYVEPHGHPLRDARADAIADAEELMRRRAPAHFDVDAWLANLLRLFAILDGEEELPIR